MRTQRAQLVRSQGEKLKHVVTGEDPGKLALKHKREVWGRAGTAPDVPLNNDVRCTLWRKTLPDGCKIHVVFSLFPAVSCRCRMHSSQAWEGLAVFHGKRT